MNYHRINERLTAATPEIEKQTYNSSSKKKIIGHQPGDEIHHNYGVDLLSALTFGLSREDAYKMMQEFQKFGVPTGNDVNNLSAITPREHKAIHRSLIDKGIEFGPKRVREADPRWQQTKAFLNKIRDLPIEQRKEIIPEYINTIIRGIDETTYDVMRYKDFHNEGPETLKYARSLQPKSIDGNEEVSAQANAFLSDEVDKLVQLIRQESGNDSRVDSDNTKTVIVNTQGAPAFIGKAMNGNGNGNGKHKKH